VLRESRFSHDTQEIAYLAPIGGHAITLRGIVYGEGFKTVSNHSVVILLCDLCVLERSERAGERILTQAFHQQSFTIPSRKAEGFWKIVRGQ